MYSLFLVTKRTANMPQITKAGQPQPPAVIGLGGEEQPIRQGGSQVFSQGVIIDEIQFIQRVIMLQWGEMIDHRRRHGCEPKPFVRGVLTTQSSINLSLLRLNGYLYTQKEKYVSRNYLMLVATFIN